MADKPLMLSVSGLRGWVGASLTPPVACRYAAAVAQWLSDQAGDEPAGVVIGRDSRPSGLMVEHAAVSGLIAGGCRVINLGIAATPTVAVMTRHRQAAGGMVITASHNPIDWNGIKTLDHHGSAPPVDQADAIIELFKKDQPRYRSVEGLGRLDIDNTANQVHVQRVLAQVNVKRIRERRIKVVLDSVHGAGGPATADLLTELGVELIHLYGQPTGAFPHGPEPTRENLTGLARAVREHQADVGFAQDPDADRLAIVDNTGRYIGEEYSLALAARHVFEKSGSRSALAVANLSTSRMIDDVVSRFGGSVIRTPVGEANVAAAMREHGAIIGGEGNGGVILPQVVYVRDSLTGVALVLEMIAEAGLPLDQMVRQMPAYAIVKQKVDVDAALLARYVQLMTEQFREQTVDTQDGVRVDWPDRWVHVRPSNTEPIIRLIAEAPNQAGAETLLNQVRRVLELPAA